MAAADCWGSPTVYENVTEKVLVRDGYTTWKKGRGPIERIDNATGEIMCLVEVPPEYKTVTKRVIKTPASVRQVEIPAEYQEVSDQVQVSEGHLEWRPILCETNTSPDLVRKLQSALRNAGYNPGSIDGLLGRSTMAAVTAYQKANGLASGQLTIKTLERLKVM